MGKIGVGDGWWFEAKFLLGVVFHGVLLNAAQ